MKWLNICLCMTLLASATMPALAGPSSVSSASATHAGGGGALGEVQDPSQLVDQAARRFLDDVNAHREVYRKDPAQLRAAVDRDVLPFFDMRRVSQLVLGRYWRDATPSQRQRFTDAFEKSMLTNYGNAIVNYHSDKLKVFPSHVGPNDNFCVVRTEVKLDDGTTTTISYAMRKGPNGWKAWDVIVDGISYVKSFRDDIGTEVEHKGLDAVIDHLERGEKPRALGGHG